MFTLEELETAYGEFWEFAKDHVDGLGWLETAKNSTYMRNCFWLRNNIEETKTHWRPKSLSK
mgnify:FL=1